ncbi:hypothetical protein chiPu_0004100 [Chiloscyllium punctatum]|uniref:Secreted protein n=1 Tax=Chiloscyllium punctatum TaxID=137246 RepID=A0A401S5P8_CHIPU|nr:hypothetical protein [Chiloscyllium punctatum]
MFWPTRCRFNLKLVLFPSCEAVFLWRSEPARQPLVRLTAWLTSSAGPGEWGTVTSCQPTWVLMPSEGEEETLRYRIFRDLADGSN